MSISLAPARPDDRYVRMHFNMLKDTVAYDDADGGGSYGVGRVEVIDAGQADKQSGWIEFWAEDAKACKDGLKKVVGRLYAISERREKRDEPPSAERAYEEIEEQVSLIAQSLALRTRAWRLVNTEGEEVDAPATYQNAMEVYRDENHNLRTVASEFLKNRTHFPLRAKTSSSPSPARSSAPSSKASTSKPEQS